MSAPVILFDDDRPSDSPFIERVWSCHSEQGGLFTSVASSHWELVVTRLGGQAIVTLRGPETRPREMLDRHAQGWRRYEPALVGPAHISVTRNEVGDSERRQR
jgi:hypothetical protein